MAAPLKLLLGEDAIRWLADSLSQAHAAFDAPAFVASCLDGLEMLDLKARANHIADAMASHLPSGFGRAANIVAASLGPELPPTGEFGSSALRYMPHDAFIARHGLPNPDASFRLQAELTKRASCEFSIRMFIVRYPERTYRQLERWARDDNAHLRRLVSEGSRPRLPWAPRLAAFQADPAPVIALLELLKDDPVRYVQRSVANNINDIGKDHPALAISLCERWLIGAPPQRQWLVRHALRDLVKKGDRRALALFGAGSAAKIEIVDAVVRPASVVLGGNVEFLFTVVSRSRRPQNLIVDTIVHYIKANGRTRPKVFKLAKLTLAGGAETTLSGRLSFHDLTTRKHYPGRHQIDAQINGKALPLAEFEVTE